MLVIEKGSVHMLVKKFFKHGWIDCFMYLINENGFGKIIIVKKQSDMIISDSNLEENVLDKPNLKKWVKKMSPQTSVKVLNGHNLNKLHAPSVFGFTIQFNFFSKFTLCVDNYDHCNDWLIRIQEKITSLQQSVNKGSPSHLSRLFQLSFRKKSATHTNGEDKQEPIRINENELEGRIKYPVFCITVEPSTNYLDFINEVFLDFSETSLILNYSNKDNETQKLELNYDRIKRYGASKSTFCIEIYPKLIFDDISGNSESTVMYFTVENEKNLSKMFKSKAEKFRKKIADTQLQYESNHEIEVRQNEYDAFKIDDCINGKASNPITVGSGVTEDDCGSYPDIKNQTTPPHELLDFPKVFHPDSAENSCSSSYLNRSYIIKDTSPEPKIISYYPEANTLPESETSSPILGETKSFFASGDIQDNKAQCVSLIVKNEMNGYPVTTSRFCTLNASNFKDKLSYFESLSRKCSSSTTEPLFKTDTDVVITSYIINKSPEL